MGTQRRRYFKLQNSIGSSPSWLYRRQLSLMPPIERLATFQCSGTAHASCKAKRKGRQPEEEINQLLRYDPIRHPSNWNQRRVFAGCLFPRSRAFSIKDITEYPRNTSWKILACMNARSRTSTVSWGCLYLAKRNSGTRKSCAPVIEDEPTASTVCAAENLCCLSFGAFGIRIA